MVTAAGFDSSASVRSVWVRPPKHARRGSAPTGLSRDRIVDAAVTLLDAGDAQSFSMRKLAAELDVTPMSVYWYVDNKDELLELALDHVLGETRTATLEENEDWLLVFDNAESADVLHQYLPAAGRGHALVTSRDQLWRDVPVIQLVPWTRTESLEFLAQLDRPVEQAGNDVAELLGDLPLALEQAFAYMRETGTSLADYRQLLATRGIEAQPDVVLARRLV